MGREQKFGREPFRERNGAGTIDTITALDEATGKLEAAVGSLEEEPDEDTPDKNIKDKIIAALVKKAGIWQEANKEKK